MSDEVQLALEQADIVQHTWAAELVRLRLRKIGRVATEVTRRVDDLLAAIARPNASEADKLASEVLPLADACRFAASQGRRVLAPRGWSWRNGAWWMGRIGVQTVREPWGTILILAPSNYPLFLPGVQMIQALAAGNAVVVKPAPGGEAAVNVFKECTVAAGIPADLVQVLPTAIAAAQRTMQLGVDKVILTGSVKTGQQVLQTLADSLTPSTMELSGCDAVFVLPQADLDRAATAVVYATRLNGGATCIAPRRIFVTPETASAFAELLRSKFAARDARQFQVPPPVVAELRRCAEAALAQGATILLGSIPAANATAMAPLILDRVTPDMEVARSDLFAPVAALLRVPDMDAALVADRQCPLRLGAAVFGPQSYAEHWAGRIAAGCVVINDVIVPTADPRVPFGGRDQSGWGVTRGCDGLLEMTRPKTICTRYGKWLPHLEPAQAQDPQALRYLLQVFHGDNLRTRLTGLKQLIQHGRQVRGKG